MNTKTKTATETQAETVAANPTMSAQLSTVDVTAFFKSEQGKLLTKTMRDELVALVDAGKACQSDLIHFTASAMDEMLKTALNTEHGNAKQATARQNKLTYACWITQTFFTDSGGNGYTLDDYENLMLGKKLAGDAVWEVVKDIPHNVCISHSVEYKNDFAAMESAEGDVKKVYKNRLTPLLGLVKRMIAGVVILHKTDAAHVQFKNSGTRAGAILFQATKASEPFDELGIQYTMFANKTLNACGQVLGKNKARDTDPLAGYSVKNSCDYLMRECANKSHNNQMWTGDNKDSLMQLAATLANMFGVDKVVDEVNTITQGIDLQDAA